MHRRSTALLSLFAAALLSFASSASAASFASLIVYGDSLTDNGNLYSAIGYPPFPYYNGRFSNGPVTSEQLASKLNIPLVDFAYGGATTGLGNAADGGSQTALGAFGLPGMLAELAATPLPSSVAANSLFLVWGGANDFEVGGSVTTAVADIDAIVAKLESEGATHILVPGLPDLGLTPEFYGSATATQYSSLFNAGLQSTLPAGALYFDVASLFNNILSNPGAYGFTNVTGSCFTGFTLCSNPNQFLFFDDIHPTAAADAILANAFANAVSPTVAATPEPSSILLLGSGLTGFAAMLRRRRAA